MFHELAHGVAADRLGDPTPGAAGRLTLNPVAHLELVGSFILPLLCILTGSGFIIGWAKPVPFNPKYFKDQRLGPALVAFAGPAMNIILAILAAIAFRFAVPAIGSVPFAGMMVMIVSINISLAIFNLIPVPPLDGHHILGAAFPAYRRWSDRVMQQFGLVLIIIVLFAAGSFIWPLASVVIRALLGA